MWISVFILTFLLFGPSQATNEGKCEITNITEDKWEIYLQPTEKVYDDANNKVIFQSPYTKKLTNLECKCTSNSCNPKHDYITIENNVAESNFIISTSDHMTDLDMDTKKTSNSYINVVYNCTMKCNTDQSSTLTIYIDIYDKNNHAPEFEEESYSYKVASPIMPVTDFTLYGASIRAQDLDFSNTKMTYTIEPNDFDITTTVDSSNTKKYVANIRANKVLTVSSPKTYVLTATDGGTDPGPLDTSVTITIDVDETLSLDIPYFEYPDDNLAAYKFDYDSNENKLTPLTGTITLNTNSPNSVTDIQLLGEMKDSFKVKFDATSKNFEISSPATIENPTSSSTALTLSLKTDIEASTPIIIQFSNVPSSAVTFKEHSYTGSYDDVTNVVTMDENIELILTTSEVPKFTITGDFSENFSIDFDEDKKVCTIVVKKNLTPEQILSKTYLSLIVEATVDKDSDKSVIVIQLPTHKLQFTSVLYSATYNADDDTVIIDADNPIGFTTNVKYVEITVDEQYSEYFQITDKFTIDVATPLPAEILSSQTELALVLTAKDAYSNQQQAVVKMILPLQETIEAPKFSKPYYAVTYVESATVIDFTDPLTFDNVDDPSLVTITLSAYADNFEVIFNNDKWIIQIKKTLDSDIINNNSELIITMAATEKDITTKGYGVLVVLLEKTVGPKFSELSYIAQYEKYQTGIIDFEKPLTFDNVNDPNEITITLDNYTPNFEVIYNSAAKKWSINVKKALDSNIFNTTSELIIKMTATEKGNPTTGAAVLVIELKDPSNDDSLQFSEIYYIVQYTKDQSKDIVFTNDITFKTDEDNTKIEIALDSYPDNFEVYYDKTSKKWKIRVKTPLKDNIFDSKNELVFSMTATNTESKKSGQTVLVMELIDTSNDNGLKFADSYYEAEYKQNQTGYIDFDKPIAFNDDDISKIFIKLDEYGEYFEVNYHSNKWQLHVKKPLDVEIFNENQNLILIMEATQTETQETGQSVLVIELLDNSVESKIPEFEEAYYTAIYPSEGKGTITFDKDINFDNVDDINRVTISIPDYTENFNVIYNPTSNQWLINIVKPLDDDTLSSNTYLTSTLSATIEEDNHTPVTAFVLKLPDHESESEPIFSKSYFVAQYSIEDGKAKVTLEDNIEFSNDVDDNNIQIVADEYSEYLSFTYDTQTKLWQVNTNGILDTSSLSRSELVVGITATDSTTKLQGRSVIDLKLPKVNNEDAPQFSRTYYKANYDMSTDTPSVILEDAIDILNRNDMSTITITTNEYRDYFEVSYNEKWQITVKKNLDQSILNNKVDIIMELIATDSKDTDQIGQSTLLITLPPVNNEEAPKFSSIFYESQCNSSTTILETYPIVINNKQVSSDINVRILEDDYKSNFEVKYNSEIKSWQVYVNSLPEDAAEEDLVLTLIATETDNENVGQAALVINFPPLEAPEFNSVQYHGDYKIVENTPALTVDDVIIVNKEYQKSNIHLKLSDSDQDLSNNFIYSYDDDKNIWKITLNEPLDDGYINGKTQLILTLTATEDGNKLTGSATVIISLPTDNDSENDLSFSDLHYEGNYVSPDEPEVQLNDDIHLISSQDLSNVVFMFDITENLNANSYFTIKKTSTDGDYVVSVTNPLPADILQNQRSLAVTLQATLGKNKASTTLVINLPIPGEENTIDFSKLLYTGSYSAIEGLNVEEITIITNENSNNLKVDISKDSPYYAYFKVTQTDKIVTLTSEDIPSDVIQKISVIPLTLIAQSSGTTKTGEAVINININNYQGSVQFDSPLFNGKYEIIENKVTVTVDPITLTTDIEDDLISVVVDKDMDKYFEASYNNSVVYLSSKLNIPDTLLVDSTLPVLLTASIKNTNSNTHTVVNLRIITDTQPNNTEILQFDGVLFTAQYSIENGKGKFEQDGDIGLTTNLQADEIDVQISGDSDLEKHFDISYKDQKVTVSLLKDISDDDFYSKSFISLTMIAKTLENSISTSAVLNIRLNNNQDADKRYISFERPVYNGNYIVENDVATIEYDNIIVNTDQEDNTVTSSIEEPYDKYFEVVYEDKTIKPMLKIKEANSVLRTYTNIAVVVSVKIKDTSLVAETVINFQVVDKDNGEKDDGAINFPKPVYNGVYNVDSNTLTQDDNIIIITQHPESDIEVEISNEYKYEKYFTVNFKNNEIAISLKENLPKDEVEKLGYIALAIRAKLKKNQKIFGDAVLNIQVQEKSRNNLGSNNNKYIIAVSVLSVLLFLVIIGVIALYFFIFRKNKYDRMTEEDYINSKVKFDKTKLKRGSTDRARSSAIEERRPTGFVFKGEGDEPRESTTDGPNMEGRKSVAFDENVEKIQIDGLNDDDIDKALRQTTEL